ncbi:tetratricopeptide repeat protein [Citrobacter braakii]
MADIHAEIGRSFFHIRKFDEAIEHYEKSLQITDSNLVRIFLSQVKMDLNDKTAIDLITRVENDIPKLSESELIDFIFTYASISISFNDKEMIGKSLSYLSNSPTLELIFEKQKNEIISQITNLYASGSLKTHSSVLIKLKSMLSRISRYLILQPNIAGLGININNIVQDFTVGPDKEK